MAPERYIKRSDVMGILTHHLSRIANGGNPKKEFAETFEEIDALPHVEAN